MVGRTYNGACVRAVSYFSNNVPSLSVVKENFGVCAHAGKIIARRCITHILHELRVRFDRLVGNLSNDVQ